MEGLLWLLACPGDHDLMDSRELIHQRGLFVSDLPSSEWIDFVDDLCARVVQPDQATEMASLYALVKRPARDYSLTEAIRRHAQACGFVAYVYDVHPDRVAEAVKEDS